MRARSSRPLGEIPCPPHPKRDLREFRLGHAPAQQKPLIDSVTATPEELAAHIREALAWTKANRDLNPANAVIIYGWNEHDEGGWLLPTLGPDGKPNEERINAVGKILRLKSNSSSRSPLFCTRCTRTPLFH